MNSAAQIYNAKIGSILVKCITHTHKKHPENSSSKYFCEKYEVQISLQSSVHTVFHCLQVLSFRYHNIKFYLCVSCLFVFHNFHQIACNWTMMPYWWIVK